ncbi:hypothetical protein [Sediminibacillus halophilus]|uniref:Uncharacterized protein n=1 Tax=Sediminibacillus halophilus TaxID=482461 RepID=A0A1G9VX37_9BACI|nr:hypothetical protein [Sediminibacillus halophilus]SDM76852.1 hypothetical protein SAMN05216244_3349 [Sediminibacillus halophilus]
MEQKPLHYDGSGTPPVTMEKANKSSLKISDEARKNISGNPYIGK